MSALILPNKLDQPQGGTNQPAPQTRKKAISPWISLVSGGVAGAVEAVATYPFEFAKTSVQLQNNYGSSNPLKVIYNVYRAQGIATIYTGCTTLVVGTTGKAAIRFLSFDTIKARLCDDSGKLGPIQGIIAGMGAGIRVKTALISDAKDTKRFRNGIHAVQIIFQEKGLRGLYQGLLATTLKQSATSAVRMGTYSMLKELSKEYGLPSNMVTIFGIGTIAGTITIYATQPFDTIKTRTQTSVGATSKEAFTSIMNESGLKGLWKGSTMRLGRLMFSGGIVFSIYEKVSFLLSGS
ncbi:mitochondrial carrier domain-containing protein [Bisporella sp. PMI_857]|nr:mitochondrial carrier domain-containing protein [Bisporella sp. PMI_857]